MRITLTVLAFLGLLLSACTKDPTIQPVEPVAIQKEVEYQIFTETDFSMRWWDKDAPVTIRLLIGKISLNDGAATTLFDSTFNDFTLGQIPLFPNQISIKKSFPIIEEKEKLTVRWASSVGDPWRSNSGSIADLEKGETSTLVRIEF